MSAIAFIPDGHTPVAEPDPEKRGCRMETADRTAAKTEVGEAPASTVFPGVDYRQHAAQPPILSRRGS